MLANLRLSREPETCDCNSAPGTLQMSSVTIIETRPATAPEAQKFRHEIGQISRQSAVFFAGTMFTSVAAYAFKIYLARALGADVLGASLDRATYLSHSVFGEIYGAVRADHAVRGVHDIPWPSSRRLQRCGAPDGYHQLHWQPSHDAPQLGVAASRDRVMGIPDCAGIVRVRSAATPCEICMEADTTTGACMAPARPSPRARGYSILDDLVCRGFTRVPAGAIRQNLIGTLSRRSYGGHLCRGRFGDGHTRDHLAIGEFDFWTDNCESACPRRLQSAGASF